MRVTVPSFAKINLDLRVLHKRTDGYHELRTIFQTISLKDTLTIDFDFAKRTQIDLDSSVDIADNLVIRAARLLLDRLKVKAWVRCVLKKQIPMGAGMGGGSSNAAATLLALTALAGKKISPTALMEIAEQLGSDVPFFLRGGTALGFGRGTELYPLADLPPQRLAIVSTGIHVSTAEAYRSLGRDVTNALTSSRESPILREFQAMAGALGSSNLEQLPLKNDFEPAVFKAHPELAAVVRKLRRLGAKPALMTGSGSAIFGLFDGSVQKRDVIPHFSKGGVHWVRFVNRAQYKQAWLRGLGVSAKVNPFSI